MSVIGSAAFFGKIKEGMFICSKYSIPILNTDEFKDYDDCNYLFTGVLHFDFMNRPVFELQSASPTNFLMDYFSNVVYLDVPLFPIPKETVAQIVIDGTTVCVMSDVEIPDTHEHKYKTELIFRDGAWMFNVKGGDHKVYDSN